MIAKFCVTYANGKRQILVLVKNQKYRKNRNFCILVPKILSNLGSSQFRFQYQSFRFHRIWNQNGTENGAEPVQKLEICKQPH